MTQLLVSVRSVIEAFDALAAGAGLIDVKEPARGSSVAFRANDPSALVSAATAGLGLAAVPCLLGDREPSLVRVTTLGFSRCDLFLVTHEQLRGASRVRAVSDFVVEVLQRNRTVIEG